jgi:outer membrane protein assembly factor BamB
MMIRFALLVVFTLGAFAADEWPRFLGPTGNNQAGNRGLAFEWDDKKGRNIKWKVVVPGEGWSSPVVASHRIFCTTALNDGKSLRAICLDFADGRILWDTEVFKMVEPVAKHKRNSHASPTPLLEGDRLYVTFGAMGTACIDTKTGARLWGNQELFWDQQNGAGGSMSGHGDLLLLACDGADDIQFSAALHKKDGQVAWKHDRSSKEELKQKPGDMHKAYGTPVVCDIGGKPVALTLAAQRLFAQDPLTGKELWFVKMPGFSTVPLPLVDGNRVYVSTGFIQNKAEMWCVKLDPAASGDVTDTHILWKQPKGGPTESTPVLVGDRLYMVNNAGIASCLNTADGSIVWQERLGPDFAASPLAADGRIYFFDSYNKTYVLEAGDTFKLLETNKLESGCMATPAVFGKSLIIRTKTHLYRIEK